MVSTRSVKNTKFSEGEKVLCYEPDPAKTKVLYNSKVLGIDQKKDEHGRSVVQFLIHFQGWNSTWDRFVTEDYILKDTEENRKLQKELAEKAQLTAGGNLYRRGRKKRTLSRAGSDNERGGGLRGTGGGAESDSDVELEPKTHSHFSPGLQSILELDNLLITRQNKLLKLPASPNAVEILDLYMKEFTLSQIKLMCHHRGHLRPTAGKNAHITVHDITSRANLCREIADGLRVYLDFMTERALLFRSERAQFKEYTSVQRPYPSNQWSTKCTLHENSLSRKKEEEVNDHSTAIKEEGKDCERRKSLRSHSEMSNTAATSSNSSAVNSNANSLAIDGKGGTSVASAVKFDPPLLIGQADLASLLGPDVVKNGEQLILRPLSQQEKEHLKRLVNRRVVTESFYRTQCTETNTPSSLIYGAVHLARALVKIPEIFPHSHHSESKINTINDYLNGFTKFLEDHPEWFGEHFYCENTYPEVPMDITCDVR